MSLMGLLLYPPHIPVAPLIPCNLQRFLPTATLFLSPHLPPSFNLVASTFPPQSNFSSPQPPLHCFYLSLYLFCSHSGPSFHSLRLPTSPQQEEGGHQQGGHVLQAGEEPQVELIGLQHDGAEHSPTR